MPEQQQDFLQIGTQILTKLSTFAESINARNDQSSALLRDSAAALTQKAQDMQSASDKFVQQVISAIAAQAPAAMAQGIGSAVGQYETSLKDGMEKVKRACDALGEQRQALSLAQSMRVWIGLALVVLGSLALLGGSLYVAWHKKEEIAQLGYQEQVARALQTQALAPCGDGLCAKVAKGAQHYGEHG